MKILKYFAYAIAAVSMFTACERQDQEFVAQTVADPNMAKLQITRMVPEGSITTAAGDNRWWKVTIDDKDVWGDNYASLGVRGIIPGESYYYTVTPGTHNIKPTRLKDLLIIAMVIAPNSTPRALPWPPFRLTPPITQAAITSISAPVAILP